MNKIIDIIVYSLVIILVVVCVRIHTPEPAKAEWKPPLGGLDLSCLTKSSVKYKTGGGKFEQ